MPVKKHDVGIILHYTLDRSNPTDLQTDIRRAEGVQRSLVRRLQAVMECYDSSSPRGEAQLPGNKWGLEPVIFVGVPAASREEAEAKVLALLSQFEQEEQPKGIKILGTEIFDSTWDESVHGPMDESGGEVEEVSEEGGDITEEEREQLLAMRAAVRQSVYAAFADTTYPGDDAIGDTGRWADGLYDFYGKDWHDVEREEILRDSCSVFFMAAEGFRYFLPAFLIACLGGPYWYEITVAFAPPCCPEAYTFYDYLTPDKAWEHFNARFAGLTPEQYQCIGQYMEYFHAECDTLDSDEYRCVKAYWEKPYFPSAPLAPSSPPSADGSPR